MAKRRLFFCRSLIERFAAISKAEIKAGNLAYKAVGKTDIEKWYVCQNCSQNMTKILAEKEKVQQTQLNLFCNMRLEINCQKKPYITWTI